MTTVFLPLIAVTLLFLLVQQARKQTREKHRLLLRRQWGQPKNEYFHFDLIETYAGLSSRPAFHRLSAQTMTDVDFQEFFAFVDRTTSKTGQQFLYDWLTRPQNDLAILQDLEKKAEFFAENTGRREAVQLALLALNRNDAYFIPHLLKHTLLQRPKWFRLLFVNSAVAVLLLVFTPFYPLLSVGLLLLFGLNLTLHFWNKNNTFQFSRSVPQLNVLLNVARRLAGMDLPFETAAVKESLDHLKPFQRKLRLIGFGDAGIRDELANMLFYLVELLKAFFLLEIYALFAVTQELENKQRDVENLIGYVGQIDTALCVASLRAGSLATCTPEFTSGEKALQARALVHPLVANCVPNDVTIAGKSLLITGSNMSGKTTFLRTVAVNSLLAQTLYLCFAERFCAPFVKLGSSIRIDDSLLDGKSLYFEEVNVMHSLIKAAEAGQTNLFVLDEVFKGTNTAERIAAVKAVLSYLNQGTNIVLVSTHDVELTTLLAQEYDQCHFSETIEEGQLQFDHKLKPGPLQTRNAIRILALTGYPSAVIDEASALFRQRDGAEGAALAAQQEPH